MDFYCAINGFRNHDSRRLRLIIAITQKFFLVTPLDFDKTARHEMCSSNRIHFRCLCLAGVRGLATAFPCENRAAI
jgi:hypothetical protein